MKRKMKLFCGVMLAGVLCTVGLNTVHAQQNRSENVNVYPIQPGTEEWIKLGTEQNKKEACRIPDTTLKKMTDAELIQATLDYPFLVEVFLCCDYSIGVRSVCSDCDALKELLSRDTAKASLVSFMEKRAEMELKSITSDEEFENEAIMAIMAFNDKIRTSLDDEEAEFINNNSNMTRVAKGEKNGTRMAYVYTPNGSQVGYVNYTCNHNTSDFHEKEDKKIADAYSVTLISPGSCRYNCHSYAWYSTSNSNSFWIPNPMIYMTDGSYSLIMSGMNSNSLSAQNGDRVFYGTAAAIEDSHSARLVSTPTVYALGSRLARSKWGSNGVFEHAVSNVPSIYLDAERNVSVWR